MWGRCGAGRSGLSRQPRPSICNIAAWLTITDRAKNGTQIAPDGDGTWPRGSPAPKEEWRRRLAGLRESEMLRECKRGEHLHGQQPRPGVCT
jgi:hypothetical protein